MKQLLPRKDKNLMTRILIADDQLADVFMLNGVCEFLNCEVDIVMDGVEAIRCLANRNYDLLILDWNMPERNGDEILLQLDRKLKNRGKRKLDYIIHTGTDLEKILVPQSENLRLLDVWKKPMHSSRLIKQMSELINHSKRVAV